MAIFEGMKNKLRNGIAISLLPQIILVKWLSHHPDWVETYYSNGIYPLISTFFRSLFGWIPFSIGEVLYLLLVALGVRYVIKNWNKIKEHKWVFLRDNVLVVAVFYFTFHLVWGMNYYRQPISKTLAIQNEATLDEIKQLTQELITKTNRLQFQITKDSAAVVTAPYTQAEIFKKTIAKYATIELPNLEYERSSIKKSMFSLFSSYMGIGGYLIPFTNEAQVNSKMPLFRFPVISGHEIGHQVGYAAENETNFIGYLVTVKNEDIYFQYTAYAYALSHCFNAIQRADDEASKKLYNQLNAGLRKNYQELRDFQEAYKNPIEPIFESVFSSFLKANNQKDGIQSYGKVVNLMVGYHKRNPIK